MSSVPFSAPLNERMELLLQNIEYKVVTEECDKEEIYKLRYRAYLKEGAISYNHSLRVHDKYDDLENAKLVGVFVDGELAASIRIHVVSIESGNLDSPAVETFGDHLKPLLHQGKIIIDPNRFVSNHELARRTPDLPYATLRMPFMAARYFDADIATATVRKEHQAFYKRILHYNVASELRHYPTLSKPLSLMMVDFKKEEAAVLKRYPFLAERTSAEISGIFDIPAGLENTMNAHPTDSQRLRNC